MMIQKEPVAEPSDTQAQETDASLPELDMDHGYQAWLQVFGSWLLFANTWGLANAYGIFVTFYTEEWLPSSTPSAIAWIGSMHLFLTLLVGIFAGWLLDAGYLRLLLISGGFLEVFGMLITSFCTQYWQILLAQGICVGMGSGLLGVTSVGVIPMYFVKKRMIATGIAATGSSLAGILYPIMLRRLLITIGFPWATRIMAFIMFCCLALCCAIMRLRVQPQRRSLTTLIDFGHFRDKAYMAFLTAYVLMMSSVYVPFFFIQKYALQLNIDRNIAFYLLSIMNASSLFGRLGPNFLADYFGGLEIMGPACLFSAIVLFFFRFTYDLPGLVAISVIYGLVTGGMISLPPGIIASLSTKPTEIGARMGLVYSIAAFGALVGNPIAGACLRPSGTLQSDVQSEYQGTWIFAGAVMLLSTAGVVATYYLRSKQ